MKKHLVIILLSLAFAAGCTTATPISKNMPKASVVNNYYHDSVIGLTFKMPRDWRIIESNDNRKHITKLTNNKYLRALMENENGNSIIEVSIAKTNIKFVWKNLQPTIEAHEKEFRTLFKNNPEDTYEAYSINGCGTPCYFLKANVEINESSIKKKLETRIFMSKDPINEFINLIYVSYLSDESNYEKKYSSYIEVLSSMEIN